MKNRKVSGNDFPALHLALCALQQQTTNNKQRATNNEQRTTNNKQQTTNNEQQKNHHASSLQINEAIRMLFKDQIINITIDSLSDETTYLSSSQANLEHLNENAASTEKKYFAGNSFQSFVNESIEKAK